MRTEMAPTGWRIADAPADPKSFSMDAVPSVLLLFFFSSYQ